MTDQERNSIEWCDRIAEAYASQAEEREGFSTVDELMYELPPMTEIVAILAAEETL